MFQDFQQIVNKIQSLFLKDRQKKFNHKNKNNKNNKSNNNNSQNNPNKKRMNKKKRMKDGLKLVNHKASKLKQKKENDVSYIINIYK